MAEDRADFVSLLFSRPRPAGTASDATPIQLLEAFYPVPVDKLLTINVPDLQYPTLSARIITLAGQPLQTRQLEVGKVHQIDVSTLAKGVYIILFRTEHQFYTRRFIKQ